MTYDDIENAFNYVSSSAPGEHQAVINKTTGESYFRSILLDIDEMPDDIDESDQYIEIPHKNDLDLGRSLVMEFVEDRCPEQQQRVIAIFSRRGAYGRYKDFLLEKSLLEEWYAFENKRTREALLAWCEEQGLVVS